MLINPGFPRVTRLWNMVPPYQSPALYKAALTDVLQSFTVPVYTSRHKERHCESKVRPTCRYLGIYSCCKNTKTTVELLIGIFAIFSRNFFPMAKYSVKAVIRGENNIVISFFFQVLKEVIEQRTKIIEEAVAADSIKLQNRIRELERENRELKWNARKLFNAFRQFLIANEKVRILHLICVQKNVCILDISICCFQSLQ